MSYKILVVDDDECCRDLYVKCLAGLGHQVILAENAKEGLDILLADTGNSIELAIIDERMPSMSGYQMIKQMEDYMDNEALDSVPVILASAGRTSCNLEDELLKIPFVKRITGKELTRKFLKTEIDAVFNSIKKC
jgi:CheY-like chemotaxis protein